LAFLVMPPINPAHGNFEPSSAYLNILQEKIYSQLIYPPKAAIQNLEGIVKIKLLLSNDGRIKNIDIAQSSGHALLDAAAILSVRNASPLPIPQGYNSPKDFQVTIPITYRNSSFQENTDNYTDVFAGVDLPPSLPFNNTPTMVTPQVTKAAAVIPPLPQKTSEPKTLQKPVSQATEDEINRFLNIAVKNNEPSQVAREEIELAQIKVMEAVRNIYPAVKVLGYNTAGEVYKVEYEEREVKLQLDQPIYYGDRLRNTYLQAKTNLDITKKNYDRLRIDTMNKTETAFYNLVAAKMNLSAKDTIKEEANEIVDQVQKLFDAGMIIKLELTSVKNWYNQIVFQINGIKQDLFMAELTFKQVLNAKDNPFIHTDELEAKRLDLKLEDCIKAGLQYRPELALSELMIKFQEYGQRIEKGKNAFTVDLSGSYGYYEGAYKTEPMRDANNWYVGLKVSKPWGASTINSSITSENSQPRFGQTSPTKSTSENFELNVMDNIKRIYDRKKSDIDLHRSISDKDQTNKTITFEVQDAFLNYQKALLQLNATETEMEFRRKEAELIKIRSKVAEVALSNSMESLYNLCDAQTKYFQALANYHISLANLKKACGYGIRI
jgi:TonB family protein